MKTGTKVLMDKSLSVRPRFNQILNEYYDSKVESTNFGDTTEVAQVVNNWVANITNNNIQNLVSPGKCYSMIR